MMDWLKRSGFQEDEESLIEEGFGKIETEAGGRRTKGRKKENQIYPTSVNPVLGRNISNESKETNDSIVKTVTVKRSMTETIQEKK